MAGMILLFSLNAHERRKGRTELLMAVVLSICVLSCSEALARFPVEEEKKLDTESINDEEIVDIVKNIKNKNL